MRSPSSLPVAVWEGLLEPCCQQTGFSVVVETDALNHILRKHLPRTSGEPWASWIPAAVLSELQSATRARDLAEPVRNAFLERLCQDVSAACADQRALSFYFRRCDSPESRWPHRWLLILPSGAIAVLETRSSISTTPRQQALVTCYFLAATCDAEDAQEAALIAMTQIVQRYCRYEPRNGKRRLVLRDSAESVRVTERGTLREEHTQFRFCSEHNWGFDPSGVWSSVVPAYGRSDRFHSTTNRHGQEGQS